MDRAVDSGSKSLRACRARAMHSLPALVASAHWKGAVAPSTAFPNCWAIVLATRCRTTSPATMPLARQSSSPSEDRGHTLGDLSSCQQFGHPKEQMHVARVVKESSLMGLLRSLCAKNEGWQQNLSASTAKGLSGTCCTMCGGRGSHALAGLCGNWRTVSYVPGARSAPSSACLPAVNSPNWIRVMALLTLCSKSPWFWVRLFLVATVRASSFIFLPCFSFVCLSLTTCHVQSLCLASCADDLASSQPPLPSTCSFLVSHLTRSPLLCETSTNLHASSFFPPSAAMCPMEFNETPSPKGRTSSSTARLCQSKSSASFFNTSTDTDIRGTCPGKIFSSIFHPVEI